MDIAETPVPNTETDREKTLYKQFCENHDPIEKRGIDLRDHHSPFLTRVNQETSFQTYDQFSPNDNISLLLAIDKEEDAVAVAKRPDGIINMAIADGVSGTLLPKYASRIAVRSALTTLDTQPSGSIVLRNAFEAIRTGQNPLVLAQEVVRVVEKKAAENPSRVNTIFAQGRRRLLEQGQLSSTTLTAAQYDPKNGRFTFTIKGDSGVVIFSNDGTYQVFYDRDNNQIEFDANSKNRYNTTKDITGDKILQEGDVAMMFSDGIRRFPRTLDEINLQIQSARNNPSIRLDYVPNSYFRGRLHWGISDDISIISIAHRKY